MRTFKKIAALTLTVLFMAMSAVSLNAAEETIISQKMLSSAMGFTQNYDEATRSTYLTNPPPTAAQTETAQKIPVLLYHHILTAKEYKGDNGFIMELDEFAAHMRYLYENGWKTVTQAELRAFLYDGKTLPKKSFLLHFDDGYYSSIVYAYPILKAYGFNATIFLITRHTAKDSPDPSPDRFMTKKDMEGTADVFEYAAHTHAMHRMKEDSAMLEISGVRTMIVDFLQCKRIVGDTDVPTLAYPYGRFCDDTKTAAKAAGFDMAFATTEGYISRGDDLYALNRCTVYRTDTAETLMEILRGAIGENPEIADKESLSAPLPDSADK